MPSSPLRTSPIPWTEVLSVVGISSDCQMHQTIWLFTAPVTAYFVATLPIWRSFHCLPPVIRWVAVTGSAPSYKCSDILYMSLASQWQKHNMFLCRQRPVLNSHSWISVVQLNNQPNFFVSLTLNILFFLYVLIWWLLVIHDYVMSWSRRRRQWLLSVAI